MIQNKEKEMYLNSDKISSKYIDFINRTKDPIKIKNIKSFHDDNKNNIINNNSQIEIISTYNYILYKLELLMNSLNEFNYKQVYSQLINIKKSIDEMTSNEIIIKRHINKKKEEDDKYNSYHNFSISFDKDLSPINKSSSDINIISLRFNSTKKARKINQLNKKNSNLEEKLKTEKLKYLFCIVEQNMKIKKLEKELNKRSFDNIAQNDFKCFPYYKKYDISDNSINYTKHKKLIINTRPNSLNKKKLQKFYHEQYLDNSENKKEKLNLINNKEENLEEKTKKIMEYGEKIVNEKKIKENIVNKRRKYYISHPKLKYVKNDLNMKSWKTNELLDSFPKELLKHKFSSKSQRNHLIVFPSSLNQIITNLEKLRIHNNFKKLENDFKEENKFKKMKY